MQLQLVDIKIYPRLLFICMRQLLAWRGLCNGQGVSAVVSHIDDGERRDFQATLGARGTTVKEVIETISAFAALGNERGVLRGNQGMAGVDGFKDALLIEQRPSKFVAKLACNG